MGNDWGLKDIFWKILVIFKDLYVCYVCDGVYKKVWIFVGKYVIINILLYVYFYFLKFVLWELG